MPNNKLQLELHVEDFEAIEQYYSALGFAKIWTRKPDGFKGYLVLEMNGNTLCFWAGNDNVYEQEYLKRFPKNTSRGYGVEMVIMVADIKAYYSLQVDHVNVVEPLKRQPCGLKRLSFR